MTRRRSGSPGRDRAQVVGGDVEDRADDHAAQVDAHTEGDAPDFRHMRVASGHGVPDLDGAPHGLDDIRKLGQKAVTHQPYDAPVVPGDLGFDQFFAPARERVERPGHVHAHEAGIADDVGGQDRGETSFHGGHVEAGAGGFPATPVSGDVSPCKRIGSEPPTAIVHPGRG